MQMAICQWKEFISFGHVSVPGTWYRADIELAVELIFGWQWKAGWRSNVQDLQLSKPPTMCG